MPGMDVFNDDAFSLVSLTAAINAEKYRPGQIGATGIFNEDGVTTTTVFVERRDGVLGLVEPTERGGPGETTGDDGREAVPFRVPHYQRDDAVLADEVQNVRAFGSEQELETVAGRVNRKLARHGQDLQMTLEHQRVGAIKGIVTSKGGVILENLYTRFGIATPAAVSLELDVETTDVGSVVDGVRHSIEDSLDAAYDGMHAFAGRDLHSALWRHKSVKETLLSHAGAVQLRMAVPDVFEFGGITWERYRTGASASTDAGGAYIAPNEARVVPVGVPDLFITRFAPADYEDTVNTEGLPLYARQYAMQNGKGRHLEAQMNAISICTRPETLRRLTLT
ncbi:major capsid protein [Limimaricola hongkongensis]|uniref:Putative phage protein n=1 Tax=Limimaricola hongkongensis DSM 17492 TaxID=1122180 RepID=A0A017HDC9_9RHOB|nr:major capsid protein [Limimaricola hongkongensis]EYD71804.1 putative phage protein [Limimaricola hongkongensis DSM 17492]